jgi:hypothetical protein
MLEPILQQVGAGNPQLAALIGQHPEQFLQLLSEDGDNDAPLPPGAQAISVTEEEREAIERVSQLTYYSTTLLMQHSSVGWDFHAIRQSKPTSPVTRTRSSRPTFSSSNPRTTNRSGQIRFSNFLYFREG